MTDTTDPARARILRNHFIRAVLIALASTVLQRLSTEHTKNLTGKLG